MTHSTPSAAAGPDFDVAIVGFGPVGAFAALLLAEAGLRIAILGVFSWLGPTWAGVAADRTGSYTSTFVALAALSLLARIWRGCCQGDRAEQPDRPSLLRCGSKQQPTTSRFSWREVRSAEYRCHAPCWSAFQRPRHLVARWFDGSSGREATAVADRPRYDVSCGRGRQSVVGGA